MRHLTTLIVFLTLAPSFSSKAQVSQSDSLALVAIYNATDGPNWTFNDNWLTGPVGTWERVTINENRVTRLDLYSNVLSGELPAEIGDLDALQRLELSSNALSGDIPGSIGNCSALQHLDIHVNEFTGLPEELADCHNLTTIIAYKNELGDTFPNFLTTMHQLERLELGSNGITGTLPQELSELTNLRQLELDRNDFTGEMPSVKDMKMLSSFHLSDNNLHGDYSEILGDSTQIYYMTLRGNDFTGCMRSSYFNPNNLQYLHIDNNDTDCIDGFEDFANSSLKRIVCQGNRLDFDDLEPLSHLELESFSYSPQDNIGTRDTITAQSGQDIMISCNAGGTITTYQWYRDAEILEGATSNDLQISSFSTEDAGLYHCEAVNDSLPGLVLRSHNITVIADGVSSSSGSSNITELNIFPNPASTSFRVRGINGQITLNIYDALGQLVMSDTHDASTQFDVAHLCGGIYFITAESGSDRYVGRLMVD